MAALGEVQYVFPVVSVPSFKNFKFYQSCKASFTGVTAEMRWTWRQRDSWLRKTLLISVHTTDAVLKLSTAAT